MLPLMLMLIIVVLMMILIILITKAFMMMTMAMIFEVPLMLISRVIGVRIIVMTIMLTCHLSLASL